MRPNPTPIRPALHVIFATGEPPTFRPGEQVRVMTHAPIDHYRVPTYLRGRTGTVERVIDPSLIDNEEEGFGRTIGVRSHYYRVAFHMRDIWPDYPGSSGDGLYVEVFELWLERI